MVVLKTPLSVVIWSDVLVLFKKFHKIGWVFEVQLIGDLVHIAICVEQKTFRFINNKAIQYFPR